MSYIYKITNKLNGKIYVGKTNNTIEKRWGQHICEYKKERSETRPLYRAMQKYGVENFSIEVLEECLPEEASIKERQWIEELKSFKYGYNATIGGDGKPYIDYELVVKLYEKEKNTVEVAKLLGINKDTVRSILKNKKISILSSDEVMRSKASKPIIQLSLEDEVLKAFPSITEAAKFLVQNNLANGEIKNVSARLGQVANGKRKTAYGYKWQWIQKNNSIVLSL